MTDRIQQRAQTFTVSGTPGVRAPEYLYLNPTNRAAEPMDQVATLLVIPRAPLPAGATLAVDALPTGLSGSLDSNWVTNVVTLGAADGAVPVGLGGYAGYRVAVVSGGAAGSATVDATWGVFPAVGGRVIPRPGAFGGSHELTRPADALAYTANDVVADSTTAPTLGSIPVASENGQTVRIDEVRLATDQSTCVAQLRVHLYDKPRAALPVATPVDNAAQQDIYVNGPDYLGFLDLPPLASAGGASTAARTPTVNPAKRFKCAAADTNLYYLLETRTAFTPASGQKFTLSVGGVRY